MSEPQSLSSHHAGITMSAPSSHTRRDPPLLHHDCSWDLQQQTPSSIASSSRHHRLHSPRCRNHHCNTTRVRKTCVYRACNSPEQTQNNYPWSAPSSSWQCSWQHHARTRSHERAHGSTYIHEREVTKLDSSMAAPPPLLLWNANLSPSFRNNCEPITSGGSVATVTTVTFAQPLTAVKP